MAGQKVGEFSCVSAGGGYVGLVRGRRRAER